MESSSRSPFVPYALRLASSFLGTRFELVDPSSRTPYVSIYHGNDERRPCGIRVPQVDGYSIDDVPRAQEADRREGDVFPFDLFSAMRFWLADEGNDGLDPESFDEHERLRWNRSAQERTGLRQIPIVNAYLQLLRGWIERELGVRTSSLLPPPARCVVVLSHDVDRPIDPGRMGHALGQAARALARGKKRGSAVVYGSLAVGEAVAAYIQSPRPRRWLFDELSDAEESRGFRSTFFFAATSRFAVDGTRQDVAYDAAAPRFRALYPRLLGRGFELGLHIGYRAGADAARIRGEKERLEDALGVEIAGGRHHYWHTGHPFWDTLDAHAAAGLRYDSSLSFNDAIGFRLGIAFPFHPWNPLAQRPVAALQIPAMAMDRAFFLGPDRSADQAVAGFVRLVDDLKRHEGIASLDWHQEIALPASRDYRHWGNAFLSMMDLLAADPEVAVRSCAEVLAMSEARAAEGLVDG